MVRVNVHASVTVELCLTCLTVSFAPFHAPSYDRLAKLRAAWAGANPWVRPAQPRMDGLEATKAIRASEGRNARAPIIFVTATASDEVISGIWICLPVRDRGTTNMKYVEDRLSVSCKYEVPDRTGRSRADRTIIQESNILSEAFTTCYESC